MWVTVKEKFRDKHTGEVYEVGEKLNISKKRKEEILASGDYIKTANKPNEEE